MSRGKWQVISGNAQIALGYAKRVGAFCVLIALLASAFPIAAGASTTSAGSATGSQTATPNLSVNGAANLDTFTSASAQPAPQSQPAVLSRPAPLVQRAPSAQSAGFSVENVAASSTISPDDVSTGSGSVVLGAGIQDWWNRLTDVGASCGNNGPAFFNCLPNQTVADAKVLACGDTSDGSSLFVSLIRSDCLSKLVQAVRVISAVTLPAFMAKMIQDVNDWLVSRAKDGMVWIIQVGLGKSNQITEPHVNEQWFLGQFSIMRQIAIFFLLPMMMVVIIQSIVRGSLYFLLRSALIMLPIALLGTAAFVKMTELMLGVANDMSAAVSNNLLANVNFGSKMADSVGTLASHTAEMTLFDLFWLVLLLLATVVIYLELVVREVGVYIAGFFFPLAFAGLVWPSTTKWLRRMMELLLALIFSKVVIAIALSLGIAAVSGGLAQNAQASSPDALQSSFTVIQGGTVVMFMAGIFGYKLYGMTPVAMAGTGAGRAFDPNNWLTKFQSTNLAIGQVKGATGKAARAVPARQGFTNSGAP